MPDQLQDVAPDFVDAATQAEAQVSAEASASAQAPQAPAAGDPGNPMLAQVDGGAVPVADGPSALPPWTIPGSDWKFSPTFKGSTDDSHDTPQNHDRSEQKANDDPRGNGPLSPVPLPPIFGPPKPDLTPPYNPFTPEAQRQIKEKNEAERRARQQLKDATKPPPEEKGDYELPSSDPTVA